MISPLGNDPQECFKDLLAGRSGIGKLQTPFAEKLSIRIGTQADFDGALFLPEFLAFGGTNAVLIARKYEG